MERLSILAATEPVPFSVFERILYRAQRGDGFGDLPVIGLVYRRIYRKPAYLMDLYLQYTYIYIYI